MLTSTMDRFDYEQVLANFMKVFRPGTTKMIVVTVVNPESLGSTRVELEDSLARLAEAGFLITFSGVSVGIGGN